MHCGCCVGGRIALYSVGGRIAFYSVGGRIALYSVLSSAVRITH